MFRTNTLAVVTRRRRTGRLRAAIHPRRDRVRACISSHRDGRSLGRQLFEYRQDAIVYRAR